MPTTAAPYIPEPIPVARRPRSLLFYTGVTAAAFLVLVLGVIVGLSLRFSTSDANQPTAPPPPAATTAPADSPRIATEEFLAAMVAGDQPKAQARLCGPLKSGNASPGTGWWLKFADRAGVLQGR